ncbi:MAG: serine protease [Candidatus Obscuribacterales bacterium]|nr:serine protease [Candidatus Obscuribacterales bacterium]
MPHFETIRDRVSATHESSALHHEYHNISHSLKDGKRSDGHATAPDCSQNQQLQKHGFPDGDHLLASCLAAEAQSNDKTNRYDLASHKNGQSEAHEHQRATGLDGKSCDRQPGKNETPTLEPGKDGPGCHFSKDANLNEQYKAGLPSVTSVNVARGDEKMSDGHRGSGTIVGKDSDNDCLGVTDYHVIHGEDGKQTLKDGNVTLANGKTYPMELRGENAAKDLSMYSIKTGADTDIACKPAKIADEGTEVNPGDKTLGIGFPQRAQTAYASPGTVKETAPLQSSNTEGEQIGRPMHNERAHVRPGQSGGPVFNKHGEVVGIIDKGENRWASERARESAEKNNYTHAVALDKGLLKVNTEKLQITPFSKADVEDLKNRRPSAQ